MDELGARRGRAGRRAGVPLVEEALTGRITGVAMAVHRTLGPGLLESAYAACLAEEISFLRIPYRREVPLVYRGAQVDCGYRLDLLVEDKVVVEHAARPGVGRYRQPLLSRVVT